MAPGLADRPVVPRKRGNARRRKATVLAVKGMADHKTRYGVAGVGVAHVVECLSIALRIISSLRKQAVRASFLVLPAATRRVYKPRRTGLHRLPTKAQIG